MIFNTKPMKCPYCNREAIWCENKEIYGKNFGKSYMCYYCKPCDAYVGCHKNTRNALGSMANKELRHLRRECHLLIDPWWYKKHKIERKELYYILSEWWGSEFHVGWLREDDCRKVLAELDIAELLRNKHIKFNRKRGAKYHGK